MIHQCLSHTSHTEHGSERLFDQCQQTIAVAVVLLVIIPAGFTAQLPRKSVSWAYADDADM
jgi:hypothetical protein